MTYIPSSELEDKDPLALARRRATWRKADRKRRMKIDAQIKIKAKGTVHKALRDGTLTKTKNCQICGKREGDCDESGLHGHHYVSYAEQHWLSVIWLCRQCHERCHAKDGHKDAYALSYATIAQLRLSGHRGKAIIRELYVNAQGLLWEYLDVRLDSESECVIPNSNPVIQMAIKMTMKK